MCSSDLIDVMRGLTLALMIVVTISSSLNLRRLGDQLNLLSDYFIELDQQMGDLRTQTLDEVWNGPPIQALRRAHLEDRVAAIPVCRSCPRHPLDRQDFIAVDQLTQRLRNYVGVDLTPRNGLS